MNAIIAFWNFYITKVIIIEITLKNIKIYLYIDEIINNNNNNNNNNKLI